MDRRSIEATLDALSRAELRDLTAELLRWVGADAAAHVLPDSPFSATDQQAQLPLAAIDTGAVGRRIEHLTALGVAMARVSGGDFPAIAASVSDPQLAGALREAFEELAEEASRAIGYDFRAGLELTDRLVDALAIVREADRAFRRPSEEARTTPDLDPLIATVEEQLRDVTVDESGLRALVALARRLAEEQRDEGPYRLVAAAVATPRNAEARGRLVRYLERAPSGPETVPLLRVLAGTADTDGDVETFVQAAELHLGADERVIEMIVTTLHARERVDEARFWIGEGRLRFADGVRWSALEEKLF